MVEETQWRLLMGDTIWIEETDTLIVHCLQWQMKMVSKHIVKMNNKYYEGEKPMVIHIENNWPNIVKTVISHIRMGFDNYNQIVAPDYMIFNV